eukprot:797488-Rhodomonas_salina.2
MRVMNTQRRMKMITHAAQTETETERQRDRETERQRETERDRERERESVSTAPINSRTATRNGSIPAIHSSIAPPVGIRSNAARQHTAEDGDISMMVRDVTHVTVTVRL